MTPTAKLAREDAITDALRAADAAIGDEPPTAQALRIIEALKRLRADQPVRVTSLDRADYREAVQRAARRDWLARYAPTETGPEADAIASVSTPIGVLRMVTWRRRWLAKAGERIAWYAEYYLDDAPITIAEIKAAGLAQRPTTRARKKKTTSD